MMPTSFCRTKWDKKRNILVGGILLKFRIFRLLAVRLLRLLWLQLRPIDIAVRQLLHPRRHQLWEVINKLKPRKIWVKGSFFSEEPSFFYFPCDPSGRGTLFVDIKSKVSLCKARFKQKAKLQYRVVHLVAEHCLLTLNQKLRSINFL